MLCLMIAGPDKLTALVTGKDFSVREYWFGELKKKSRPEQIQAGFRCANSKNWELNCYSRGRMTPVNPA